MYRNQHPKSDLLSIRRFMEQHFDEPAFAAWLRQEEPPPKLLITIGAEEQPVP
ncbi:hypothetical protein [Paenibacillus sp. FSL H8-0537]|uniref:hypothetical protein n=1 Tax=Paenibacillus sp. FSL H8-0537 TaxID=2921399 RepID=UPI0031017059